MTRRPYDNTSPRLGTPLATAAAAHTHYLFSVERKYISYFPTIMDVLSDDSSRDEYMVDIEDSDDDYDSVIDDELQGWK